MKKFAMMIAAVMMASVFAGNVLAKKDRDEEKKDRPERKERGNSERKGRHGDRRAEMKKLMKEKGPVEACKAIKAKMEERHAEMVRAHRRAVVLRSKVVPALEEALNATREGYRQGKFAFLDMLDAQRGLSEVRKALVIAFTDFQLARIGVWSLTAGEIEELTGTGPGEKQ